MAERKHKEKKVESEKEAEAASNLDNWLHKGIIVKVLNKKVGGGEYYKKKGVVKAVHDKCAPPSHPLPHTTTCQKSGHVTDNVC
jgi:hypothetical protein